jgi:uncharacterized membrane protein YcaP (DUF421 family)
MKKEDIHFGDWQRMFIGDVPGGFYWEVVLRITVVYIILMVSMRLMGKRMASQLSRNEMIAMVSLAAAIGVPLQTPDRGILAAVVIAFVVVSIQQLVAWLATRNQFLESVTQGDLTILVSDGYFQLKAMKQNGITRERAFAQLRSRGIRQLGEVKRLYFEAGGSFSFIPAEEVQPGLCVLPEEDMKFITRVCERTQKVVCKTCGKPLNGNEVSQKCNNCHSSARVSAVI